MTLHLTRISRRYALQVSDRLVSGGLHDPLANKNLIYWARDAVVSIGYAGLAYELSSSDCNVPTDEWIAEILWGRPIPRGWDGARPVTFANDKISRWLDIGQSVELLFHELQNSVNRLPFNRRKLPFELIIVGWQEKRRRAVHPVIVQIIKPWGNAPFVVERPERGWYLERRIGLITTPDGYVSAAELSSLAKTLSTASPDESENLLVEGIRRVASQNPSTVGPHCMSIFLAPLGVAPIRVRFISDTPHTATFTSQDQSTKREVPVAFSPWIVGPNMFYSPAVRVGCSHVQMGPFEIVLEAPTPKKGILGYMGALHRPSCP